MKRRIAIGVGIIGLLVVIVSILFLSGIIGGKRTVSVAVNPQIPGIAEWKDGDTQPAGLAIDLLVEIATRENWKMEFSRASKEESLSGTGGCSFDVAIMDPFAPDAGTIGLQKSTPYFRLGQSILVRSNSVIIAGATDLPGKAVGVVLESAGYFEAGRIKDINAAVYQTTDAAIQSLTAGNLDAVLLDTYLAYGYQGMSGSSLKVVGEPIGGVDLTYALCGTDSSLVEAINRYLNDSINQSLINEMINKWLIRGAKAG